MGAIQGKLKKQKKSLKGWGHNIRGQANKLKKDLSEELQDIEELEEIQPLQVDPLAMRGDINSALFELYDDEEEFRRRKSGENWLHKGDNNTIYFHRIANSRRRKNVILSLHQGEEVKQGTTNLVNHATDFYKSLFGRADGFQCHLRGEMWGDGERLTVEEQTVLDMPFGEDEIKGIIDSMERNKAVGHDGFAKEFYQSCWEIVKDDVIQLLLISMLGKWT